MEISEEALTSLIGPSADTFIQGNKMSHKSWKKLLKKLKRKLKRRKLAQNNNLETCDKSSSDNDISEQARDKEVQLQMVEHARWLERERQAQKEWELQKQHEEQERKRREEQDRRIREEWEEQERKETEEREKLESVEKAKKEKQEALLKEATINQALNSGGQCSHNPLAPISYHHQKRDVEVCSFFAKTGACRFGERCSRNHPEPEVCTTLVFPGMYTHMTLDNAQDDYDTDLTLEFEEGEIYENFKEFYEDVLPEFKAVAQVVQFKVSCNYEPHLRGNVYVQFKTEEDAFNAFTKFNGRWYGGRQLSCHFVEIKKWGAAICGLYSENRCHKGKSCNFLHVFKNPTREFQHTDRNFRSENIHHHNNRDDYRSHSRHRSSRHHRSFWRHSLSPLRHSSSRSRHSQHRDSSPSSSYSRRSSRRSSVRKRSRSRSPSRKHSRSRSPSRKHSRSRSPSRKRSKSRSPSRKRSRSRSPSRKRSRSRSPPRKRSRSRSRSLENSHLNSLSPDSKHSKEKTLNHHRHKKDRNHKKTHSRSHKKKRAHRRTSSLSSSSSSSS
ncbi:U2 small nuclear ribonucleoprotein auxiliary factor 35 kDa subunit-related protein 2 isoform X1 [Octopus sinensis]|uniref:U2 small nuclear ribonucleoprotein auxiliary factor 35 kDa subunit-related protein 2 isoform X1 n=1 Tax=Octopus sinensis TaxID=2607531 RepID=A0A6P7SLS8_9MOLL|nr:U2 small nuclear ribonucleoprotein auxiliary factor 35 kDa subunit-related protein 2 isoform X1 [Octopus sinensis]